MKKQSLRLKSETIRILGDKLRRVTGGALPSARHTDCACCDESWSCKTSFEPNVTC